MVSYLYFVGSLACIIMGVTGQASQPVVNLPQGEVRGSFQDYIIKPKRSARYSIFRGIPYAKAPVELLRLKEPVKIEGRSPPLEATSFGPNCPQWDSKGQALGEEDCLYINIYTPMEDFTQNTKYPVMVYIHGGNFQRGSADPYDQNKFIESEVVLVTFNYRLGILGFLSTGDEACPGNLGLKDQVFALQWIRDNIQYFGGNPNSVTLFGQGAGAVSVFLHILSPESQNLFHRAITQSGSPLCDWALEGDPHSYAVEVAKRLGCPTKSNSGMVDCIREQPLQKVLEAQRSNKTFGDYPLRTAPVVDKGFLPDTPANLLLAGNFKRVPLMSGVNKGDGTILYPLIKSYEESLKKDSSFLQTQLIPMFLWMATNIRGNIESVTQAIYFQYFYGVDSTNVTQVLLSFVSMTTDAMFVSCNYKTLEMYSDKGQPVYMYAFEYKGKESMLNFDGDVEFNYEGVAHGDELIYLFNMIQLTNPNDTKKKEQLDFIWSSFATEETFSLSVSSVSGEYPIWSPYTPDSKKYYNISSSLLSEYSYKQREVDFWLDHLPKLSKIMPVDPSKAKVQTGGVFTWTMFAIAIILMVVVIALVVMLRKSKKQYVNTSTEDK